MNKYKYIIIDSLILMIVSTLVVWGLNSAFKGLKKSAEADSLVTVIMQNSLENVKATLGERGFKEEANGATTIEEYQKNRIDRKNEFGRTPLMWAAYHNSTTIKDVEEVDQKRLPIVEFLFATGASVNAIDNDGWSSVMWSAWSGLNKVTEKLLELGANPNLVDRQGQTALMFAAQRANVEVVKILLAKGADRMISAKNSKKAIDYAHEYMGKYPDKKDAYQAIITELSNQQLIAPEAEK